MTEVVQKQITDPTNCATSRIAPAWPLDNLLASSPYWGLRALSFEEAAALLRRVAASAMHLPLADYLAAWEQGAIPAAALAQALHEAGISQTTDAWVLQQQKRQTMASRLPLLSDYRTDVAGVCGDQSWRTTIIQQISQFCAAWFDHNQAEWQPDRSQGFYAAWREDMLGQRSLTTNLPLARQLRAAVRALPDSVDDLLAAALQQLKPAEAWQVDWLHALLLRNHGWAAWCRYLAWQADLHAQTPEEDALQNLLVVQLAWEMLLDDAQRTEHSHWQRWQADWYRSESQGADRAALIWLRAQELATHTPVLQALLAQPATPPSERAAVHAVFCIDVRSEPMRRALESTVPGLASSGFAGFFGLPLALRYRSATLGQARLPGLLPASLDASLPAPSPARTTLEGIWSSWQRTAWSGFSLVESVGGSKLWPLLGNGWRKLRRTSLADIDPWLGDDSRAVAIRDTLSLAEKASLLHNLLPAMGLSAPWPKLVLLVAHASQSSNNPQASALQCGACGGHGGHLHVILLAKWLNDPALQEALAARGCRIPDDTWFVPMLHLTHSDELQALQSSSWPDPARAQFAALQPALALASARARQEKAVSFGLDPEQAPSSLLRALRGRGQHWAEVRPEWGLVDNAFFIAAPRARSKALNLAGRAFLHEYDYRDDTDGSKLTGVLAGPLVVAHWINMQYFASTVDPLHFGSGNKLLHNVVGGRIGVFEGNSGDLRIGLAQQSLHDGQRWRHTPLRLAVCLDAPESVIDLALARLADCQKLVDGGWLHLYGIAQGTLRKRVRQGWCDA